MGRSKKKDRETKLIPSLIVRPEAEEDIISAYSWYESQRVGLGDEFLYKIEDSFGIIKQNPNICRCILKKIRRKLMQRFPYAIFYVFEKDIISIIAVIHVKRHPKHWKERMTYQVF